MCGRYEDHLPYFDFYARDAGVGFLAFNFRGVVRSEGGAPPLPGLPLITQHRGPYMRHT